MIIFPQNPTLNQEYEAPDGRLWRFNGFAWVGFSPPLTADKIADFAAAVVAAAPPTIDASLLTTGTLPDARLAATIARSADLTTEQNARVSGDAALSERIDYLTANLDPAALDSIAEAAAAINTLQAEVDGKALAEHTHTAADIEDFAEAVVAVSPPVDWSSLTGKPTEFPPEAHTQDAFTITGLSEFIISSAPGLQINTTVRIGDGTATTFPIDGLVSSDPEHVLVALNGVTQTPTTDYLVSEATGTITFDEPPAAGMQISCTALGLRTVQPPIDPTLYLYAFDQSSDGLTTFLGRLLNADRPAEPALPETATTWTIRRSTLNAAGRILATASATGAWADRTTLSYS